MKTAAAALASSLALALAACGPAPVPYPPFTDVTFYWQFQDMDTNVYGDFTATNPGCLAANVDAIRVTMTGPGGTWTQVVPCIASNGMPGATFGGLPTGPYTWLIEGRRLNFTVFEVSGAGELVNFPFLYPRVRALYPNMDLYYDLPGAGSGASCLGVTEIAFELVNGPINPGVVEYSSANVLVACREPPNNGFTMPSIPIGTYGYRYVEAWQRVGPPLYQACRVGYPPSAPLVQTAPNGNAYHVPLDLGSGFYCP